MKVISINQMNYGSTGTIMLTISRLCKDAGMQSKVAYPFTMLCRRKKVEDSIRIGDRITRTIHAKLAYYLGYPGLFSVFATLKFCLQLSAEKPDIVHLHNLHGNYVNLPILFWWLKHHTVAVVWTLHDCWSFTGQCPHFSRVKCDKWRTGCYDCPKHFDYPATKVDKTKRMWKWKRRWFTGVANMTIVTPSNWLANYVKQSFLGEYPVKVIHNGIDLEVFRNRKSNFRETHGIRADQFVVLGVSAYWVYQKGTDVFKKLSHRLDPDQYRIVMVGGVGEETGNHIISIARVDDPIALAEIYSAADIFINPTREENYPTVNMEAIACGVPVVTFDTGGCVEIIDEMTGVAVPVDDVDAMEREIRRIHKERPYSKDVCMERAQSFEKHARMREYIHLYEELTK